MGCGDREGINIIITAHRQMTTRALGDKSHICAVGLEVETAPASPSPAICTPIAVSVLYHQLDLHECSGMYEAVWSGSLLPGNLGEARAVGPWRNIPGCRRLYGDVIPENEAECVVVATIGETDRLPGLKIRVEWQPVVFL